MPMNLNRLTRAGQCQMIAVERAHPGVVERVVVETAKPFAPRIVRPNPFLELILDASIAESSNAATVKKNQNHGSRSRWSSGFAVVRANAQKFSRWIDADKFPAHNCRSMSLYSQ